MTSEIIRIFEDGKIQHITNGKCSRLYDPYAEGFRKGDIFRLAVALFDHGWNKFSTIRKQLYRDILVAQLISIKKAEEETNKKK